MSVAGTWSPATKLSELPDLTAAPKSLAPLLLLIAPTQAVSQGIGLSPADQVDLLEALEQRRVEIPDDPEIAAQENGAAHTLETAPGVFLRQSFKLGSSDP